MCMCAGIRAHDGFVCVFVYMCVYVFEYACMHMCVHTCSTNTCMYVIMYLRLVRNDTSIALFNLRVAYLFTVS